MSEEENPWKETVRDMFEYLSWSSPHDDKQRLALERIISKRHDSYFYGSDKDERNE